MEITDCRFLAAVPFRVRIPAPSKKQQIPRRGFVVFGGDGGIYAFCFAIRRPAPPPSVGLDHSLFAHPPEALSSRLCPFGFESLHHQKNNKSPGGDLLFLAETVGFMRFASQSAVLRLLLQSAWTTAYSRIHRKRSLHGCALSGSNPCTIKKTTNPQAGICCFGGDGGIRTHVPLRTTRFRVELVMTTSIRLHNY